MGRRMKIDRWICCVESAVDFIAADNLLFLLTYREIIPQPGQRGIWAMVRSSICTSLHDTST